MTATTTNGTGPVPNNHDRSDTAAAKIVAIESATSLSMVPRQAHITPLTLFSDQALLGPLGASLLPRSPPPPLTPHLHPWTTVSPLSPGSASASTTSPLMGPAGLPLLLSPTPPVSGLPLAPTVAQPNSPPAPHFPKHRRRRASVASSTSSSSSSSPPPSSSSSTVSATPAKRQRKSSIPANFHHHPYRRRTSSSSTCSSSLSSPSLASAAPRSTSPAPPSSKFPARTLTSADLLPLHQLAAHPTRNRHPRHLTFPASSAYPSATAFTACPTPAAGAGAGAAMGGRKRPRAISTPATFAALRSGPSAVAVGPIEAWADMACARAFLTPSAGIKQEQLVAVKEERAHAWHDEHTALAGHA